MITPKPKVKASLGKVAKQVLQADKAYIPLDDLYVFQSTLGDMPSNMDDLFDAEDAKLLRVMPPPPPFPLATPPHYHAFFSPSLLCLALKV